MKGPSELSEGAERRQVTMLHCDIVNSSAYVNRFDPEQTLAMMRAFVDKCRSIVETNSGTFVNYTGDGFQAYFGYPVAHEDDAVDAVSAALQVIQTLEDRDDSIPDDLKCRIGIATGRVVVSQADVQKMGQPVVSFGTTAHLATRLEQAAKPGGMLIDVATQQLCGDRFVVSDRQLIDAKGFDEPIAAWEVFRDKPTDRRFAAGGLSPFVAREAELELLRDRWKAVLAGSGQSVLVSGSAGIGKSRLVHEFRRTVAKNQVGIYQFQCSRQHASAPLHPWVRNVQRFAGIDERQDRADMRSRLRNYLTRTLGLPDDLFEPSAQLFGLADAALDTTAATAAATAETQLRVLQQALVKTLHDAAKRFPILVLVEDVQWIDASTLKVIQSLIETVADAPILLLITSRAGEEPELDRERLTRIDLSALDDAAVKELISTLMQNADVEADRINAEDIWRKCDGSPLYVEELTRHALSTAGRTGSTATSLSSDELVPNVLQGPLMHNLDEAGDGKIIAQVAAVVGVDFDHHLIANLLEQSDQAIAKGLSGLIDTGVLSQTTFGNRTVYRFRHALLLDAVYSTLLHSHRRSMHLRVAEYFAGEQAGAESGAADLVAHHFQNAGDSERAFRYWVIAGNRALASGATKEAANLFRHALELVSELDESTETLRQIAELYSSLGYAVHQSEGAAANPVEYYHMAEKLFTEIERFDDAILSMSWQFGLYSNAGNILTSQEPGRRMKALGLKRGDTLSVAAGCQALGMSKFWQGEFGQARKEFEQGLETAVDMVSGAHCFPSMSQCYLGWSCFFLGEHDLASELAARAIVSARLESTHAIGTALGNSSYVYSCLGMIEKVREHAQEMVDRSMSAGLMMMHKRAVILQQWAEDPEAPSADATELVKDNISQLLHAGEEIEMTFFIGLLAGMQAKCGFHDDAAESLRLAWKLVEKNKERFNLSELSRLQAELNRN